MEDKTALILSGSAYNVTYSLESLMKNLVLPNNCDVFVVTTKLCKRRRTPESEIPDVDKNVKEWEIKNRQTDIDWSDLREDELQLIRDTFGDRLKVLYIAEDNADYTNYLNNERNKMMYAVNSYIQYSKNKNLPLSLDGIKIDNPTTGYIRMVVDQYRHIKKCYELMEQYERSTGTKYKYIMRARIDFICPFELNIEHYTLNHDESYFYTLGSYRRDPFEWADEFCWFSKRDVANKLFPVLGKMGLITNRRYNTVDGTNNDTIFSPECQFSLLLRELNLPTINVKIYRSCQYSPSNPSDGYDYFNYKFRRDTIDINNEYELVKNLPTDINEHVPILRKYAEMSNSIVEAGTRYGNSTVAFLAGIQGTNKPFTAYDPQWSNKMQYLKDIAKDNNLNFEMKIEIPFNEKRTESTIPECDLLFIDTNHNVESIFMDISLHSPKCKKYMILHDTESFILRGQGYDNGGGGMGLFLTPWIEDPNCKWRIKEHFKNNNGLTVYERVKEEDGILTEIEKKFLSEGVKT